MKTRESVFSLLVVTLVSNSLYGGECLNKLANTLEGDRQKARLQRTIGEEQRRIIIWEGFETKGLKDALENMTGGG